MDMKMMFEEREAFLADVHVAIMAVERTAGPGTDSLKHRLLKAAERFSLCAQDEDLPYKYVSVEGPITSTREADTEDMRAMAHRYMGPELGDLYVESTAGDESTRVTMIPDRWFTLDYSKMG
jgi:hypothetical protein